MTAAERRAATRRRILAATADALDMVGIHALTVDHVLQKTRMGRNTFYAHFDDVAAAVAGVEEWGVAVVARRLRAAAVAARTPIERLRALSSAWVDVVVEEGVLLRAVLSHTTGRDPRRLGSPLHDLLADELDLVLSAAHAVGIVSRQADTCRVWEVAGAYVAAGLRLASGKGGDRAVVAQDLVDLALRAFR